LDGSPNLSAEDAHLAWCDERIAAHAKDNPDVKKASTLMGIGPIGASAAVATVGDFKQFDHAAQFGAWIDLTPRQHSSGGRNSLGGITKRSDPISVWAAALQERVGWQKAAVALAKYSLPRRGSPCKGLDGTRSQW
jgi:transposase